MELYEAIEQVSDELKHLKQERDELTKQLGEKQNLIDSLSCCYTVLCEGMEKKYRTLSDPERLAADYANEETRKYAVKYLRDYMGTFFPNAKSIEIKDFNLDRIMARIDEEDVTLYLPSYSQPFSLSPSTFMYELWVGIAYKSAFDPAELIQK